MTQHHGYAPANISTWLSTPPPAVEWVFEGLIARGSITALAGPPGVGQSYLGLELALSLAGGAVVLDPFRPAAPGRVLLLAGARGDTSAADVALALSPLPGPGGRLRLEVTKNRRAPIPPALTLYRGEGGVLLEVQPPARKEPFIPYPRPRQQQGRR